MIFSKYDKSDVLDFDNNNTNYFSTVAKNVGTNNYLNDIHAKVIHGVPRAIIEFVKNNIKKG